MIRHSPGQTMAMLTAAAMLQKEATPQRIVCGWSQTLFRALGRVWAQLDTDESLASADQVAGQMLDDVSVSLGQLSVTLERTCRRLKRHLQARRSSNVVVAPTLMP